MSLQTLLEEVEKLNPQEKLELVTAVWDNYKQDTSFNELTEGQRAELKRRRKEYLKNPQNVLRWEEVKAKVLRS